MNDIKSISSEITTLVKKEDGSFLEEKKVTTSFMEREPDYVKLYIKDILRLSDIPNSGNSILFAILKRMTYNNDIALYAPVKREIATELDLKEVTVSKAIELFASKSILIRKDRGLYIINPYFFGRGKWEEIRKIRLEIIYSASGRMILKTEFEDSFTEGIEERFKKYEKEETKIIMDKVRLENEKNQS